MNVIGPFKGAYHLTLSNSLETWAHMDPCGSVWAGLDPWSTRYSLVDKNPRHNSSDITCDKISAQGSKFTFKIEQKNRPTFYQTKHRTKFWRRTKVTTHSGVYKIPAQGWTKFWRRAAKIISSSKSTWIYTLWAAKKISPKISPIL